MREDRLLRGHRDLKVYPLAYKLAMEIFEASKVFPSEKKYSLPDQIRLSTFCLSQTFFCLQLIA